MESGLVSWQVENFSSAELNSPPVSPVPAASPILYHHGIPSNYSTFIQEDPVLEVKRAGNNINSAASYIANSPQSSKATHRAQMATNLLNQLEQIGSLKTDDDFSMNWSEESINLGLFEELSEIEYTPPASPKKSLIASNKHHYLTEHSSIELPTGEELGDSEEFSALTAEFQAILESLPKDNTEALGKVLEIAGIPTTIIDGEALVPIEVDLSNVDPNIFIAIDDISSVRVLTDEDEDIEMEIVNESEIYDLQSVSGQGSPSGSVYSNTEDGVVVVDDDDFQANTAEKILDALLLGDINTAESFILPNNIHDESSMSSNESDSSLVEYMNSPNDSSSSCSSIEVEQPKKKERRGRKPGKKFPKGSLEYIKDKTLRKKEQNKSAATRYRQKKKIEVAITLQSEAELQDIHDNLEKKKDDLDRQIVMVKQLLREVMEARRPPLQKVIKGKSSTQSGRLAVSSVVGKNRRR